MTLRNWGERQLIDWNNVLVDAVFEKRPQASRPINWIDVTPKFLVTVAGASLTEADQVRAAFLQKFRQLDGYLFRSNVIPRKWDRKSSELPFFSYLYLSLLAASAVEDTHEEGNFRNRLGMMLNSQSTAMYEPLELASLWETARDWSLQTSRPRTRELVLPADVGTETRIGYSKRLAFPGFKDFNVLADALVKEGISGRSPAENVIRVIAKNSHRFSDRFRDEFRTFKSFVSSGDRAHTSASPLWSAVEAADWGSIEPDADKSEYAKFQFELVLADLGAPEILLLFEGESLDRVNGWIQRSLPRPISGYHKIFLPEETTGETRPNAVDKLSSDLVARRAVQRFDANLVGRLQGGILAFAQDEIGRWVETTSLTDVPTYWLACDETRSESVKRAEGQIGIQGTTRIRLQGAGTWFVSGPYTATVALREKLEKLFPRQPAFHSYIRPPRVRLFDTIRMSTGIFFRWPVIPIARSEDAARITCQATVGGRGDYPPFDLEALDGPTHRNVPFSFPEEHAQKIEGHTKIVLHAFAAGDDDPFAETSYELVSECTDCNISTVGDLESWLVDGSAGQLVSAADGSSKSSSAQPTNGHGTQWSPIVKSKATAPSPQWISVTEASKEWNIFIDALCGIFGQRVQLGPEYLRDLVSRVWRVSYRKSWWKIEELVQNGWIRRLYRRRWRGNVVVGCPPKLFVMRERTRLIGLLPSEQRRELAVYCRDHGLVSRQARDQRTDTYGAIEIVGLSSERAQDLSALLHIAEPEIIETQDLALPSWREIFAESSSEVRNGQIDFWRPGKGWSGSPPNGSAKVTTLRRHRFDSRQDRFGLIGGTIEWFTESRSWALLGRTVAAGETIGDFDKYGAVTLRSPELVLPTPIAHHTMVYGGGLCFRTSLDNLTYTASQDWGPITALRAWKASDGSTLRNDRRPSLERWQFALEYRRKLSQTAAHGKRLGGGQS